MISIQLGVLLTSVVIALGYVIRIWTKFGIQKSISISFYDLPKDRQWSFRFMVFSLSIALVVSGFSWIYLASGLLLSLVGIFPRIKNGWKRIIHLIGAIGGIGLAVIGLWVVFSLWWPLVAAAVFILVIFVIDRYYAIWWSEIFIILLVFINLFIVLWQKL